MISSVQSVYTSRADNLALLGPLLLFPNKDTMVLLDTCLVPQYQSVISLCISLLAYLLLTNV